MCALAKVGPINAPVIAREEDVLAVVAALGDMMRDPGTTIRACSAMAGGWHLN